MKNLLFAALLALTAASLSGCHSFGDMCGDWFNRGDRCGNGQIDCAPGMPQATMMVPTMSSPQVLPGPIEIAPTN